MEKSSLIPKALALLLVFLFAGIFLSFKGLFFSKISIDLKATDQIRQVESLFGPDLSLISPPERRRRLVLLLVDALKYSFIAPTPQGQCSSTNNCSANIFTSPAVLMRSSPENTLMFKSIADHPTTTSQRLKAIATGNIPVYMEIGQNLGTLRVTEDTFLYQLAANNKKIVFMGDDAWTSLHNNSFYVRAYPHESFDIFDLEGIDITVRQHLFSELRQSKDWDVLLAHCTGLDHAGHAFGGNNREITRKLREMDALTTQVIDQMDNDTSLLLFGDHGMLLNGNHGGSTEEEVSTVLFVYSKVPLGYQRLKKHPMYPLVKSCMESLPHRSPYRHPLNETGSPQQIQQIDMVPSIARIAGVPIPHNNLGTVIPALLVRGPGNSWVDAMYDLTVEFMGNAYQAYNYVAQYVNIAGPSKSLSGADSDYLLGEMRKFREEFVEIVVGRRNETKIIEDELSSSPPSGGVENRQAKLEALRLYVSTALRIQTEIFGVIMNNTNHFRSAWSQFDPLPAYVSCGLLSVLAVGGVLILLCVFGLGLVSKSVQTMGLQMISWRNIAVTACLLLILLLTASNMTFAVCVILAMLCFLIPSLLALASRFSLSGLDTEGLRFSLIFLGMTALRISTLFSDSLIYFEGKLSLYFKVTLVLLVSLSALRRPLRLGLALRAMFLLVCCVASRQLIPTYERAMSKVMDTDTVSSWLESRHPYICVLLPVLAAKFAMQFLNVRSVPRSHLGKLLCLGHLANDALLVLYEILRLAGTQSELTLLIPKAIYGLVILLLLLEIPARDGASSARACSVLYNLQVILGESVCPLGYLLMFVETYTFHSIVAETSRSSSRSLVLGTFGYLSSLSAMYMTGHVPRFTHLQLFSGFVGFEKFHYATTPLLVYLNTGGPLFLALQMHSCCAKLGESSRTKLKEAEERPLAHSLPEQKLAGPQEGVELSVVAVLWTIQLTCTNIFVTVERENLHFADYMAPKFIFDVGLSFSALLFALGKVAFGGVGAAGLAKIK